MAPFPKVIEPQTMIPVGTAEQVKQIPCTKKQKRLVDLVVTTKTTIKDAAAKAGYAKGVVCESGRVAASNALRLPHVKAFMAQRVADELNIATAVAARAISNIVSDGKSEYVVLLAAQDILDRAGYKSVDRVEHRHEGLSVNINLG